jgi:hypothetical protein
MKRNGFSIALGIVIVVFGVILAGNQMNFWELNVLFAGWWTLFIIIPSAINIGQSGIRFGNTLALIIGVTIFLSEQQFINLGSIFSVVFPFVLIAAGLAIVFAKK